MSSKVGVLALQGAFAEHIAAFLRLGAGAVPVRLPSDLHGLDGVVIPGGESTTMSKLMADYGFAGPLRDFARSGKAVWGTCAGLILLGQVSGNSYPETLGLLDAEIERNAFGSQLDSFETDLLMPALGADPFHGIFIRAPRIGRLGPRVQVMSTLPADGSAVAVRQGNLLGSTFHPELTEDLRFHSYFLGIVSGSA